MKVSWEAADGYVGKSRPQTTRIDDSDILSCETEDEVRDLVRDCIQEDFEQKVCPDYSESEVEAVLDFWKENKDTD